jgi:hypothetical protein
MDGVKYDMMKEHMPFLASLNSRPLLSEFGYSCACHATMYTSRHIDEHGTWFIWKKGDNSPYKWVNKVPFLKYINFLPLKLVIGKVTNKLSKNTSYSGVPCLVNLPLKYWGLFKPCDNVIWNNPEWKKDIPNLFTILKENGVKHNVVALHKKTKADDIFVESQNLDFSESDFIYYFIGYTDNMMHSYGEGKESQEYFTKVDKFIKREYEKAFQAGKDVQVIVFSDHGHIDVIEPKVNINDYFTGKKKVNDYIHLIESNYARFWFRNEAEKNEIEAVIKRMTSANLGFIIDDEMKNEYHLNVNPKEHGELVFYLAAPREFANTIWGFGHSVKSGHGYEPSFPKHYGIFCTNAKIKKDCKFVNLVDILPTALNSLNIQHQYTFRGTDLIERNCTKND